MRRLKQHSPRLDAVYLGNGLWSVIEFSEKPERMRAGREAMHRLKKRGAVGSPTYLQMQLMAEGWSGLVLRECPELDERDVRRAARLLGVRNEDVRIGIEDAMLESTAQGVTASAMRKAVRTDTLDAYRDAYRYVRRQPHTV